MVAQSIYLFINFLLKTVLKENEDIVEDAFKLIFKKISI